MSNNNNNLNLGNLKSHTNDILKAEIGSLFILLEKTSIDKWKNIKVKKHTCPQQIDYFPAEIRLILIKKNSSST
jgi:hypothetical protein